MPAALSTELGELLRPKLRASSRAGERWAPTGILGGVLLSLSTKERGLLPLLLTGLA